MTGPPTQPSRTAPFERRNVEPLLTRRTILLLVAAILVSLLFVHAYRRQQGPCRSQFQSLLAAQPRLLRVQEDDENPGDAGPGADPCGTRSVFGYSSEQVYAALALALWGAAIYCSVEDVSMFRAGRRRLREWNAIRGAADSSTKEEKIS